MLISDERGRALRMGMTHSVNTARPVHNRLEIFEWKAGISKESPLPRLEGPAMCGSTLKNANRSTASYCLVSVCRALAFYGHSNGRSKAKKVLATKIAERRRALRPKRRLFRKLFYFLKFHVSSFIYSAEQPRRARIRKLNKIYRFKV